MITTIINALFSISLFVTGGNIVSTNLKLHHYSDDDYKDIFHLRNNATISKNCTKHSTMEDIKIIKRWRAGDNGGQETVYKITKKDVLVKVDKKEEN